MGQKVPKEETPMKTHTALVRENIQIILHQTKDIYAAHAFRRRAIRYWRGIGGFINTRTTFFQNIRLERQEFCYTYESVAATFREKFPTVTGTDKDWGDLNNNWGFVVDNVILTELKDILEGLCDYEFYLERAVTYMKILKEFFQSLPTITEKVMKNSKKNTIGTLNLLTGYVQDTFTVFPNYRDPIKDVYFLFDPDDPIIHSKNPRQHTFLHRLKTLTHIEETENPYISDFFFKSKNEHIEGLSKEIKRFNNPTDPMYKTRTEVRNAGLTLLEELVYLKQCIVNI